MSIRRVASLKTLPWSNRGFIKKFLPISFGRLAGGRGADDEFGGPKRVIKYEIALITRKPQGMKKGYSG
jgi:hypothetical protein